jgi:hypothetical protein
MDTNLEVWDATSQKEKMESDDQLAKNALRLESAGVSNAIVAAPVRLLVQSSIL